MSEDVKALTRKAAFTARKLAHARSQSGAHSAATERLLAALLPHAGRPLAGYMPIRTEIDPRPAMARHPGPVGVPVIVAEAHPLVFRLWSPDCPMIPGAFGAPIPETGRPMTPQVLIVPMLAFDRRGFRLGYGGGFYDRTLERLRARGPVTAIGFAFADQEIGTVPTETTDQPLDLIVTERETIRPA
ncbi:5-formyltetrahydrofolate cyclo-ligase [Paenirhodobacter enshiensis]|uniref:5-formyltetrahydrofolate cyclo-ligase n=1 Tax=Paenirhodobacter enshiensis TaxID=1105367 RepID=A0A086Y9E6_9RHOB|nr:5-formyltetrahydrofolate cyclo-ligase [Paenirhodobacter enshiensis]KFI30896.1 5-formyltetrahydrofolate cyclo-ligase [Paenirhodobacter enshiensis]